MTDEIDEEVVDEVDSSVKRVRRKRGTGFPVMPLSEAAGILKEAGKYGFEHPTPAFASYMGHSTTNSGAFRQRLSAFRDWELLSGRGDMLTMTEVARMIAMPTGPEAERRAMQEAFRNCEVFTQLYERSAKGQALNPEQLGGRAVHEFGVSPANAGKFTESFVESALAADLAEVDESGNVMLWAPTQDPDVGPATPEGKVHPLRPVGSEPTVRPVGRTSSAPTVRQSWPIGGGEIVFELWSDHALPATAFAALGDVVSRLEALAASLSPEDSGDTRDPGGED